MAPVTRRSPSAGVLKPSPRLSKSSKPSLGNIFDNSDVGLALSILRETADSALHEVPQSFAVESNHAVMPFNFSPMSMPSSPAANGVDGIIRPLSAMAERVGQEVEDFAEKVDKWRTKIDKADGDEKIKFKSTMALAEQLAEVAEQRLVRVKREMGSQLALGVSRSQNSDIPPVTPGEAEKLLRDAQSEVNTWRLFRIILESDFREPGYDQREMLNYLIKQQGSFNADTPGSDVWERFMMTSDTAREQKCILEWLELVTRNNGQTFEVIFSELQAETGKSDSDWTFGWQTTRQRLKIEKQLLSWSTPLDESALIHASGQDQYLITQLDPDAPSRQRRILERPDSEQEPAVWHAIFKMIRAGLPLGEIRSWLVGRGEQWRAVSLGLAAEDRTERTNVSGPDCGSLWRRICHSMAQQEELPVWERAVYGLLGGDPGSASLVCSSWDDLVYANYNALVLGQFQRYLEKRLPGRDVTAHKDALPGPVLVNDVSDADQALRITGAMMGLESTARESRTPEKLIQAAILARDMANLTQSVGKAVSQNNYNKKHVSAFIDPDQGEDVDPSSGFLEFPKDETSMRLIAHINLILHALRPERPEEEEEEQSAENEILKTRMDNVMVAYMDILRRAGKVEALPTYASFLLEDRAERVLGRMMADVTHMEEQTMLINLVGNMGMQTHLVLLEQYHWAIDLAGFLIDEQQPEDWLKKYKLIEWVDGKSAHADSWPEFRISEQHVPRDLTDAEEKIIRACEWFLLAEGRLKMWFHGLGWVFRCLFLHGRWSAALALSQRVSYNKLMELKTPYYYEGRTVDIMEDEVPDEDELHPNGNGPAPSRDALLTRVFKTHGKVYYQLTQLTTVLESLGKWREAEDQVLGKNPDRSAAGGDLKTAWTNLVSAMEPLLHDFLNTPRLKDEACHLTYIRRAYLPSVILAYLSAISFAGTYLSREHFAKSLELAVALASDENKGLLEAFVATEQMMKLVRALGLVQMQLVRVNEMVLRSEAKRRKKKNSAAPSWRGNGMTLDLWRCRPRSKERKKTKTVQVKMESPKTESPEAVDEWDDGDMEGVEFM